MLNDVIQNISGATVPGVIGTILLMLGFVGVVIWAFRLDRRFVLHMSRLPLDSQESDSDDRGVTHG